MGVAMRCHGASVHRFVAQARRRRAWRQILRRSPQNDKVGGEAC